MRRIVGTVVLAVVAALLAALPAPPAGAWRSDGDPVWTKRTVYYFVVDTTTAPVAARAAKAINNSGANVKLVRTLTKSAAKIVIRKPTRLGGCEALATTHFVTKRINGVYRTIRVFSSIDWEILFCNTNAPGAATRMLTHELGHSLGLDHEPTRCATMNATFRLSDGMPSLCVNPGIKRWEYYCRLLEPDDIRGLVARYGGTAKAAAPRICLRGPAPGAVTGISISSTNTGTLDWEAKLAWTPPPAPATAVEIRLHPTTCLGVSGGDPGWTLFEPVSVKSVSVDYQQLPESMAGTWCATFFAVDKYGQPGPAAQVLFEVPDIPPPPPPAALTGTATSSSGEGDFWEVNLSWDPVTQSDQTLRILLGEGACPTSTSDAWNWYEVSPDSGSYGFPRWEFPPEGGAWCASLYLFDELDRTGPVTQLWFDVPPPPPEPPA